METLILIIQLIVSLFRQEQLGATDTLTKVGNFSTDVKGVTTTIQLQDNQYQEYRPDAYPGLLVKIKLPGEKETVICAKDIVNNRLVGRAQTKNYDTKCNP